MAKKFGGLMLWLGIAAIVVLLDQLTKITMSRLLVYGQSETITPYFNLVMVYNQGAAFSFLANSGGWQRWFFIAVSVLVVGAVSFVCLTRQAEPLDRWVGAFVAGGGGGNLIDRLQTGAVVDFLDFHWRNIHWPAFNLADVFIVCSMLVGCFASMRAPPRPSTRETPGERPS